MSVSVTGTFTFEFRLVWKDNLARVETVPLLFSGICITAKRNSLKPAETVN